MKTLHSNELATVAGGASKSDTLTTTLASVQTSIKDLASTKSSSSNDMLMPIMMMMALRPQAPTVVAAGAPAPAGPIVNISSRIGRRW